LQQSAKEHASAELVGAVFACSEQQAPIQQLHHILTRHRHLPAEQRRWEVKTSDRGLRFDLRAHRSPFSEIGPRKRDNGLMNVSKTQMLAAASNSSSVRVT